MPLIRLLNGFDRMNDAYLYTRSREIYNVMNGNPNFANPKPNMSDFNTMISTYGTALENAASGDKYAVIIKNAKRKELVNMLHNLGYFVLFTAQGDRDIAASSGFELAKEQSTPNVIGKPQKPSASIGDNPGELVIGVAPVKGAKSYLHQYTTDATLAESSWVTMACTQAKCYISGLQSGVRYWVRVAAIGSNDQIKYSDVVTCVVQ